MANARAVIALPLVASIACACAGTPQTASKALGPTAARHYAPLTIKADAKRAGQALVLGTDDHDGSTLLPLPAAGAEVTVDAGRPIRLAVRPIGSGAAAFEVHDDGGAAGRPGVWVAAFVATSVLDKDLSDVAVSATFTGASQPSASALIAAGLLAAMTGSAVDPSVTMLGLIDPDGTIGPAETIADELVAALGTGKKRIGLPVGLRVGTAADGKPVDLIALAAAHGATAVEVADIFAAYQLLTGKSLPRTAAVAAAEMATDAATNQALEATYKGWQQRLATEWSSLLTLQQSGRLPAMLLSMVSYAQTRVAEADKLHAQGLIAAAYAKELGAWVYAASANITYRALAKLQSNDVPGAIAELPTVEQLDAATAKVFTAAAGRGAGTLAAHLAMTFGFESGLRGLGYKAFAAGSIMSTTSYLQGLAGKPDLASSATAEQIVGDVGVTVLYAERTLAETELAIEELELDRDSGGAYTPSIPSLTPVAAALRLAATSLVDGVDLSVLTPAAATAKIALDDQRKHFALHEPDYVLAFTLSHTESMAGIVRTASWADGSLEAGTLMLAGSELAFHDAAQLIAKYESLGTHTDPSGKVESIAYQAALTSLLVAADQRARAAARAARIATGSIPVQARLAYQLATAERSGDLGDRVDALSELRAATAFAEIAVVLARND